jgi:hypothetical protein
MEIKSAEASRGVAWLMEGFEYFRRNALAWIGIVVILVVISIASGVIPLAPLIVQFLTPVFMGGLILGCRDIGQGGTLKVNHLFAGFSEYAGNLVLLGVLYTLGVIVITIIMVIMMFFTLGGLEYFQALVSGDTSIGPSHIMNLLLVLLVALLVYVPLLMGFWFAPALVVLENLGPLQAIQDSFVACVKNIMPFLLYGVVGLVFSLLASIPFMLGWFILMPMIIASVYIAYLDIFASDRPVTVIQE